jgi:hypothetical protein
VLSVQTSVQQQQLPAALPHLRGGEEHAVVVPVVHAVTAVAMQLHHIILQAAAAGKASEFWNFILFYFILFI